MSCECCDNKLKAENLTLKTCLLQAQNASIELSEKVKELNKKVNEIVWWIKDEISENKEFMQEEPNTSHGFTAYMSSNDTLYRLLEFINGEEE